MSLRRLPRVVLLCSYYFYSVLLLLLCLLACLLSLLIFLTSAWTCAVIVSTELRAALPGLESSKPLDTLEIEMEPSTLFSSHSLKADHFPAQLPLSNLRSHRELRVAYGLIKGFRV